MKPDAPATSTALVFPILLILSDRWTTGRAY
jgi:hypothetical protein